VPFTDPPPTQKRKGGIRHLVDDYLDEMTPDEAEGARRWLTSQGSAADIAAKFTAEGYPLSGGAVSNWRRAQQR